MVPLREVLLPEPSAPAHGRHVRKGRGRPGRWRILRGRLLHNGAHRVLHLGSRAPAGAGAALGQLETR